jgi:CRISPR-associated protein Csx3
MKIIEIIIGGNGIIQPQQLPQLLSKLPPAGGPEPVIISGRLPVWAYGAIVHYFHPRPFVATFEPRLVKAVVVASHVSDVNVGDIIDMEGEKITVTFP